MNYFSAIREFLRDSSGLHRIPIGETGEPANPVSFSQVVRDEQGAIKSRRERAFKVEGLGSERPVGLALSGGGIRSATFNLGLLQSLFRSGLLKYVDYLSTVSGGGYIGSYLTYLATRHHRTDDPDRPNFFEWKANPLRLGEGERLSPEIQALRFNGKYLMRPLAFFNRFAIGLFYIACLVFSFVLALAAIVALLWRVCDHRSVRDWLALVDLDNDLIAAFLPALPFLFGWLGGWFLSYMTKFRRGRTLRKWSFPGMIVALAVAVAVLIGNGDIDAGAILGIGRIDVWSGIRVGLVTAVLLSLSPLIWARQSNQQTAQPLRLPQNLALRVGVYAAMCIPLVAVGWMAREDISGYATERGPGLVREDIADWDSLAAALTNDESEWHDLWFAGRLPAKLPGAAAGWNDLRTQAHMLRGELNRTKAEELKLKGRDPVWDPWGWPRWFARLGHRVGDLPARLLDTNADATYWAHWQSAQKIEEQIVVKFNARLLPNRALHRAAVLKPVVQEAAKAALSGDVSSSFKDLRLESSDDRLALASQAKNLVRSGGDAPWDNYTVREFNRRLLEAGFPGQVHGRRSVRRRITIESDQWARSWWFLVSSSVFGIALFCVSLNHTTIHEFYRRCLLKAFITPLVDLGGREPVPEDAKFAEETIRLDEIRATEVGAPYHLVVASLNLIGRRRFPASEVFRTFLFSRYFCGSEVTGYAPTSRYLNGKIDLDYAMAISGAAVSPTIKDRALAIIMFAFNLRLGQWLPRPNPGHVLALDGRGLVPRQTRQPRPRERWIKPWQVLRDMQTNHAEDRNYCFVTDGAHYENLGLEELLLRRCALILVSDATADPGHAFSDFIRVVRRVRIEHGIMFKDLEGRPDVPIGDLRLKAGASGRSAAFAIIRYPANDERGQPACEGLLIYLKSSVLLQEESIELAKYRTLHAQFPNDPTVNQFYDEDDVEAYRLLGYQIGQAMLRDFPSGLAATYDLDAVTYWLRSRAAGGLAPREAGRNAVPSQL